MDRYINKWLHLLAHHQKGETDTNLSSSMVMILAPKHYEAYTVLHFGFVVEPCPSFLYQLDDDAAKQSKHEEFNTPKNEAGMGMVSFKQAEAADIPSTNGHRCFRMIPFFYLPKTPKNVFVLTA
jgi:hypothetical protein